MARYKNLFCIKYIKVIRVLAIILFSAFTKCLNYKRAKTVYVYFYSFFPKCVESSIPKSSALGMVVLFFTLDRLHNKAVKTVLLRNIILMKAEQPIKYLLASDITTICL